VDCINAQPPTRRSLIDRAERAEAELAALKSQPFRGRAQDAIDRFAGGEELSHEDVCEVVNQAVCAERELAALKARIEGAIDMGCVVECFLGSRCGRIINPFTPSKWIGKRVRLVVGE
jgi:hypothetical protein